MKKLAESLSKRLGEEGLYLIICSMAAAFLSLFLKFSGFWWNPIAERWGPLFTGYGYTWVTFLVMLLIVLVFFAAEKLLRSNLSRSVKYLGAWLLIGVLFYSLRPQVRMGDGVNQTMIAPIGQLHYDEPLATYCIHLAFVLFGPLGLDPFQSAQVLWCGLGSAAVFLVRAMVRRFNRDDFFLTASTSLFVFSQFGILQELAGDVESYGVSIAALIAFSYICMWALRKKAHPLIPAIAFGVLFCFHVGHIFVFPSLFCVLWWLGDRRHPTAHSFVGFLKRGVRAGGYAIIGVCIPYLFVYGIMMKKWLYLFTSGHESGFVRFSWDHVLTVLSMQMLYHPGVNGILLATICVIALMPKIYRKARRIASVNQPAIFFMVMFGGLFLYSTIWNVYGTIFLWRNEFVQSWDTFTEQSVPAALFAVCFFPTLFHRKKLVISALIFGWALISLLHTVPLVWWNHVYQTVDFSCFRNPALPLRVMGDGYRCAGEIDVGSASSERKYRYTASQCACTEQVRFPPGGRFATDRIYLSTCRAGRLYPIASMAPSFAGAVDGGRLCLGEERFIVDLRPRQETLLLMRMHTGLGPQNVQIFFGTQELPPISLDPSLVESPLLYERYYYRNPVFTDWPMAFEWQWWREFVVRIPAESVAGGPTQIRVVNRGPFGYGSFHYFVFQKDPGSQNLRRKPLPVKKHLFRLSSFESRLRGGTWRRLPVPRALFMNKVPFPPIGEEEGAVLYRNASFGGSLFLALVSRDGWVDYLSFPIFSEQAFLLPSLISPLIFESSSDALEFSQVCDLVISGIQEEAHVAGMHLRRQMTPMNITENFYALEIMREGFLSDAPADTLKDKGGRHEDPGFNEGG
jgi:hypothetical protein